MPLISCPKHSFSNFPADTNVLTSGNKRFTCRLKATDRDSVCVCVGGGRGGVCVCVRMRVCMHACVSVYMSVYHCMDI